MSRLFVAVWPPPVVVETLAALPRDDLPGVRWTTADQWHVTLRYLGDVEDALAHEVLAGVSAQPAVATLGPTIDRLGTGVVVVPVAGLDELAESVRMATASIGEAPHPEGFRGHVTLARQKRGDATSVDGLAVEGQFEVGEIALVRSELHADGARYTTVAVHPITP